LRQNDLDLGVNVDQDPEPEILVYDDDLARKAVVGLLALGAIYLAANY
jgi:hypothetical protein